MNKKIQEYADAIKAANKAAIAADPKEDGGTCNLDSVVINFKGWRQTSINELERLSGTRISRKLSGIWSSYRWVSTTAYGQGGRNTVMVEAASKKLRELGIPASVYYAMD